MQLDDIEADLLRCEAILAVSGLESQGGLASSKRSNSKAAAPRAVQMQRLAPSPRQQQQQSQPSVGNQPAGQQKPKPKNMADLLAMLENAPAGPVEIDTALLYSPQSSADLHGSPSASSVGGYSAAGRSPRTAREPGSAGKPARPAERRRGGGAGSSLRPEFSLKAYRPLPGGAGEDLADAFGSRLQLDTNADSFDGLPSPGAQPSLDWEAAKQQQMSPGGLLSPADSEVLHRLSQRPLSAPAQRGVAVTAAVPPGAASLHSYGGSGSGSASRRQLKLDDVIAAGVQGATAGLLAAGREARLQRLAEPRRELWERCALKKLEVERQELQECTFAPQVGRPPESSRQRPGVPVDERLYRWNEGKAELLQRTREAQDGAQLAECTFTPQLNQPERHLGKEYTPIHKRVGEEQKKRSVKLAQLRVLEDLTNPHTTFTPRLNPKSLQMAAEREERELYSPAGASGGPRSKSVLAEAHADGATCTFSPALNPASQRLLEDSATVPSDFQERLRYYSQRRDAKQRQMQAEQDTHACTFRPDTGNAVEVLAFSARAGHLLESEAERCERMAGEEAARQEARRAAKEREIYGALDFKPQLNPRSLRMAKASTVEELASAEKAAVKVARLRAEEEERLRRECTFRPNTAKPRVVGYADGDYEPPQPRAKLSIAGQGFEGILDRIQDYQAEREAKAARAKEEAERRQLQECSFAPEINRQPVRAKGPVVIRGLDRFLEQKQLAERQRREAEERAAQVFLTNPRSPAAPRTVPQPFKLEGQARLEQRAQAKQSEAVQSALQERLSKCTFRPQTNHAKRQQALAGILGRQEGEGTTLAWL